MSFKYTKGSTVQGDIKAADDTQRDTLIDFGEDTIEFQTSGSTRLKIENNIITTSLPIHISGSWAGAPGLRIAKGNTDYREIQFENEGVEVAFIQVDNTEGLVIGCQSNGQEVGFYTTGGDGTAERMRIQANGRVGIGTDDPQKILHVSGSTRLEGQTTIETVNSQTNSADLINGSISFYLDEGNNQLKVRVKYSDGLLKTGTIALS